ncbi:hypothetical protein Tco_0313348 [Tanacetum coccineum]
MEIKQEQLENFFMGTKRKPPFNNVNVTTLFKKVKEESVVPQNESEEIEMKTDTQIKETISRMKNNLKNFGFKLRDGGEKLKVSLRKYEDELERRNKIKPPPVLPVNIPVSAEVEPKSLLISSPAPPPPPEAQQAPNTHSVDSVQHMISNNDKQDDASNISSPNRGLAVNKPLFSSGSQHAVATSVPTADADINDPWIDEMMQNILNEVVTLATESTGRKPSASGNDDRPPVTFLKGSGGVFVQQNQEQDIELKTDSEIKETIARLKRNLVAFGHKLHDKGEKIKESILRYEHELQRRNKIRPGVLPVNIPVSAQVNPTSQLLSPAPAPPPPPPPPPPQECPQSTVTHLVDSVKQMVSNDGNKDGDSNLPSRDHVAGNKPSPFSGSQYGVGVAANGSTVNADKHDSLTDEKMLKIVHELVTVGIAHTEVGKAAEVCYKDPVKAKVLFALPDYVQTIVLVTGKSTIVRQRLNHNIKHESNSIQASRDQTDCLVKEQEKVHLGIKVGENITVTGVPGQEGAEGNVAEKKKGVYES